MTSKEIKYALAKSMTSPFYVRKQVAVVPNVSWGFLAYEADLLVLGKHGYLTEIEIKVSFSDWKKDFEKRKWKNPTYQNNKVRKFYYAAPSKLAARYQELPLPEFAGVIAVEGKVITTLKSASTIKTAKKLSLLEAHKVLRLAAIKMWGLQYKEEISEYMNEAEKLEREISILQNGVYALVANVTIPYEARGRNSHHFAQKMCEMVKTETLNWIASQDRTNIKEEK